MSSFAVTSEEHAIRLWTVLTAALKDLGARQPATLEEAADNYHTAVELEARAIALHAATKRDLRPRRMECQR